MGERRMLAGRTLVVSAVALAAAGMLTAAQSLDRPIDAEIRRVRADIERELPEAERPAALARLDRAAAANRAGRRLLALYEIESPWETAASSAFVRAENRVTTVGSFAARWKALEPPAAAERRGDRLPLAAEALAASADARAPALYLASLPFAEDADVPSALAYLGESHAVRAYGAFVRSLRFPPPSAPPALRSLTAELDALDREMTQGYAGMRKEEHPAWIIASVTLKRARTLNESGHLAGALLEYLLARYRFGVLRRGPLPDPPDAGKVARVRGALATDADHTIAQLFLEMAETALESANVAVKRSAALIVDDVLPAYHAALRPPTSAASTAAHAVTITLVRWPFT